MNDMKFLHQEVRVALARSENEVFEDGMTSKLGETINILVLTHGLPVLYYLHYHMFICDDINAECAGEILISLGHLEDPSTQPFRLILFETGLFHPSIYIREGAVRGLECLKDPTSVHTLKFVAQHEEVEWLRDYYIQVSKDLEE
jgi:hypothetical protein